MNKLMIAPSILSADFSKMGEEIVKIEKAGADIIHCDVMDGVFVPNITFGIKMVKDIRKVTSLPLDAHLMIVEPWKYVEAFAKAGADYITVHYEACKDKLSETLDLIKSYGVKCGAVISPDTPVSAIMDVVEKCDMILVMSVYPGFGGQKYIPSATQKVIDLRKKLDEIGSTARLEIDGGINFENIKMVKDAGADTIVAGSTVFNAPDTKEAITNLKQL